MSSIELILTPAELASQQCPLPSVSTMEQATNGTLTGIVTYIKLANGDYQILSRYENDLWTFPAHKGVKGLKASDLNFNFSSILDDKMKYMAKWVVWNEMIKGAAIGSLIGRLKCLKLYFKWVLSSDITSANGLTAFTSNAYVKFVNAHNSKQKGEMKPLSLVTKRHRLYVLEQLYRYCSAFDFVKEHPWPDATTNQMAGYRGKETRSKPKTLIIRDDVLIPLCKFTQGYLDGANELLTLRDKLNDLASRLSSKNGRNKVKTEYLQSLDTEFNTLKKLNEAINLLRDSCIFWLLLTTGMRIHEVLGIKRRAYRSETLDGTIFYYIETVSEKTHTGLAEWIAPKIAIQAIDILERLNAPLQEQLERDLITAKSSNNYAEVHRLEGISNHICLSKHIGINILTQVSITSNRLPNLCKYIGSDWNLTAHQFRRTFANYVVHSELGDLRALKDHFKHWSITMTALYAFNDDLDAELFEELLREKYLVEEEIKQDWFELDMPITGGALAQKIMQVREDDELIKAFGSHSAMVKAFSSSIPIRSTGIGWCTNDDECMCDKPDSCDSGIVDKRHAPYWTGILVQQMKLLRLGVSDIGEAGIANLRKGMDRCEKVLTALGFDVEAMKQEINQKIAQGEDIEGIEVVNV